MKVRTQEFLILRSWDVRKVDGAGIERMSVPEGTSCLLKPIHREHTRYIPEMNKPA
ncbi:MAG: hypothetical protein OJF51_000719 [Nitrospira sp.]|nr:MAG: hypothetical protein OJF51_000719 [Nitrospira sp.]